MLSIKKEAIEIDKEEAVKRLEMKLRQDNSKGGRVIWDFFDNEMMVKGAYQDSRSPSDDKTWSYIHGVWRLFDRPMIGRAEVITRIGWEKTDESDKHELQVLVSDHAGRALAVAGYRQHDQFYTSQSEAFGYNVKNVAEVIQTFTQVMDIYRKRAELLRDIDRIGGFLD